MASTSTSTDQGICLPYEEAIKTLPEFMKGNDEHEQFELAMFLSQVDQLHKPDGTNVSAESILDYVKHILELAFGTKEVTAQSELPQVFDQLFHFTGEIATEIASKFINDVDFHNITLGVLSLLQQFSWETKVALAVTTYILTFGDSGRNLCVDSKLSINKLPRFLELLLEITIGIVEFEKLVYMTSEDPQVKVSRTHFIVDVYWITRAIVAISASHINTISNKGHKFGTTTSTAWDEKLDAIKDHLQSTLLQLQKLQENDVDVEAYKRIKDIINEEDKDDNVKVLNALLSVNDYAPQLYDGLSKKKVQVDELEGKTVLLYISSLDLAMDIIPYEHDTIKKIYIESRKKFTYEMVWIPVIDHSQQQPTGAVESLFAKLKDSAPWYSIRHPWMIKNAVRVFFKNDWNFQGETVMVVLDPRGNVVNRNAINMMLMLQNDAFPFTTAMEEKLWEQESWGLKLLTDGIDPQVSEWVYNEELMVVYGGKPEWIGDLITTMHTLTEHSSLISTIKMVYVGERLGHGLSKASSKTEDEDYLSHYCLQDRESWHYWRRIDIIIQSMIPDDDGDGDDSRSVDRFKEIIRLYNNTKSDAGWAILAVGSLIFVNGQGESFLSSSDLIEFDIMRQDKFSFAKEFADSYKVFCRRTFPSLSLEIPTEAVKFPRSLSCPDCHQRMRVVFICNHNLHTTRRRRTLSDIDTTFRPGRRMGRVPRPPKSY